MSAKQHIFRVRRNYNQWVNNQTLEDYALRFTAKGSRKWSLARVSNTALGAISFLILEAIGGAITISYGFDNALASILVVSAIIFFAGIPICYYAAKYGVDIDLLTRGAGFGYIGSTTTSLIYASFTFIFFALEAAIMAVALELLFNIPLPVGYVLCSLVVIPLVTHGITFISHFQLWTQPIWVLLQLLPFIYILYNDFQSVKDWQDFQGLENETPDQLNMLYIGACSAVMFSLIAQIGEQVDYLRFLPEKTEDNKFRWWFALLAAGPGWIIVGALKIIAGSLLAYIALRQGFSSEEASDPARMYIVAYEYVTHSPHLALVMGAIFVILSQLKINVTNSYAGSIAWSNFFSRLTHSHPGRVVWLIFNVVIALTLMELGIYQAFEKTLGVYAIVAVAWLATIVADLIVNKPLGFSPPHIEFKRAHLYDINPVGIGSMSLCCATGFICYSGFFGEMVKALSHFFTFFSAFIFAPLIAVWTKGNFYIARQPVIFSTEPEHLECCICQNHYEREDIASCPAYDGPICSLCCSLDVRCQDFCKGTKGIPDQLINVFQRFLPKGYTERLNSRFVQFVLLLLISAALTGIFLFVIYLNSQGSDSVIDQHTSEILWQVFLIFLIISGVTSWLFILAHESRIVAQEESQRQNSLLSDEIEAHKKTDSELQLAKEQAEAANLAKSRYLTGISHELRSPLNSILGYAQLLENDREIPQQKQSQIAVIRRSGEHLADLIEGLLDISKIEAGRLQIHRDQVRIKALMDQLVYMFRLQAEDKKLTFNYHCLTPLPEFVTTDEKRLRQILINLLSNAIKFTEKGEVTLSLRYKNQVAVFEISDSGVGIPEEEIERIFKPFERVRRPGVPSAPGTGLGLTIVKLMTEIMGGDIQVKNNAQGGTSFTLTLMLSDIAFPVNDSNPVKKIYGYKGARKTIMVVDDDASHRGLISHILMPLGFIVLEAPNGDACLTLYKECQPDIFLMDIMMPGIDGRETAQRLRQRDYQGPIITLSANAYEAGKATSHSKENNDYIAKPIKLDNLLDKLAFWLKIEWRYENTPDENPNTKPKKQGWQQLDKRTVEDLINLAEIGHLTELKHKAAQVELQLGKDSLTALQLNEWILGVKLDQIIKTLRDVYEYD